MSVLAEAESLARYSCKRLALSYNRPTTPKPHSPKEDNMTWDVSAAMLELENFPPNENNKWSSMVRKYSPPKCWHVLKETAVKTLPA